MPINQSLGSRSVQISHVRSNFIKKGEKRPKEGIFLAAENTERKKERRQYEEEEITQPRNGDYSLQSIISILLSSLFSSWMFKKMMFAFNFIMN